jgi:hypothetical protein
MKDFDSINQFFHDNALLFYIARPGGSPRGAGLFFRQKGDWHPTFIESFNSATTTEETSFTKKQSKTNLETTANSQSRAILQAAVKSLKT